MRLMIPAALTCALLGGCQGSETQISNMPEPEQTGSAGSDPFFVGYWAVSQDACETIPWEFTKAGLSTPGEVSCTFDDVKQVQEGYEIAATCTAEGPPTPHRLKLSRAESADSLLVDGGPFTPIGLVSCN